jgi:UDP-4-amino-4-deoxy-L-arabinose formyltransferase/UDP-glucuronic acid dehydrogenase (UDP-4-keto-hexauronic acid decarboxylating)
MKIAIIGRSEMLYDAALALMRAGHEIACILTAKEAPEYTKTAADFRALASQLGVPFAQGVPVTNHFEFLKAVGAEIAVSTNYVCVIPQEIIDIFPLGILNMHGGDLPRYRGNACQAWAILNGETRIGLCVHHIVGGELDSGDIVTRDYLSIDSRTKITEVLKWIAQRIPDLIIEAVERLTENPEYILERQSKESKDALRCYPRKPEDGRINWGKPALDVLRLINACNKPYAGAFCEFEDERVIIWDAELVEENEIFCAVPGQITRIGNGFVEVACNASKLRILSVEYRGQLDFPSAFVRSIRKRFE